MAAAPVASESAQEALLAQAVGYALAAWARVEDELSLVFVHTLNGPAEASKAARAVFYSVRSFEARLNMVRTSIDAWANPLPPDPLGKEWNALYNRLRNKNKTRNEIAHAGFMRTSVNGKPSQACLDPYLAVMSGRAAPGDNSSLKTENQLLEAAEEFKKAAIRVSAFETDLALHRGRHPTSLLRANHPDPAIRAQAMRIQASQRPQTPATPPQPSVPSPQADKPA